SSYNTPFQADTIFGHLCWAAAFLEGSEELEKLLDEYNSSTPMLVSDGFPSSRELGNYLPRPMLAPKEGDLDELKSSLKIGDSKAELRMFFTALKAIEKKKWLSESAVKQEMQKGGLSHLGLAKAFLQLEICPAAGVPRNEVECKCNDWKKCPGLDTVSDSSECPKPPAPSEIAEPVLHNVINRFSGASLDLFSIEERFPNQEFYFIARIDEAIVTEDRLKSWMDYIAACGYGADASTGKGALKDLKIEPFEWQVDQPNAFINLSSAYVPLPDKPLEGWYDIHLKRGKLGAHYAVSYSPWKKPILMLKAGSVFRSSPNDVYGQLIPDVHYTLPKVVQYGYAFPLGVKIND
ncbi:MAG: hypothetical protein QME62_08785, partial [Armatimonadota bacterium]|nr:hypothetical protein [Armatimonadota bacterium]